MKPLLQLSPILIALCCFCGCGERQADLGSPITHQSGALTFQYPKNWKITDDSVTEKFQGLLIESPGDAVAILHSYPSIESIDLSALVQLFSQHTTEETPIGKLVKSKFTDLPTSAGFTWVSEDFDVSLVGQSIPHKRLYGAKTIGERKVFLILQAANEDYQKVEAGFELIRDSLKGA